MRFDPETGTGLLENADIVTASMLARRANCTDEAVLRALALAVWAHRNGHACLNLDTLSDDLGRAIARSGQEWELPELPSAAVFEAALRASPLVRVLDAPGTSAEALADTRPLVLIENRFSSQRHFADEVLDQLEVLRIVHQNTVDLLGQKVAHGALDEAGLLVE